MLREEPGKLGQGIGDPLGSWGALQTAGGDALLTPPLNSTPPRPLGSRGLGWLHRAEN